MARGRLISSSLGSSRKFRKLREFPGKGPELGEFAQVLFVLLVTKTDDFGLLEADAETVKMKVFPSSAHSEAEFEDALVLLHTARLIKRYSVDGDNYLQIIKFDEHQTGLHKRTKPQFPEPSDENSWKFPEIPGNSLLSEVKGREHEVKGREGGAGETSRKKRKGAPVLCDIGYVERMQLTPAFRDLNVQREYDKAVLWCTENHREPTRRFFLNWLNRADRPVLGKNGNKTASQVGAGSNVLGWINPLLHDIETFKTSHVELFDRCEELSDLICSGISEQEARGKFAELKSNA